MGELSKRELEVMRHAAGIYKKCPVDRNYFVADDGSPDAEIWIGLVERRLARSKPYRGAENSTLFSITPEGFVELKRAIAP